MASQHVRSSCRQRSLPGGRAGNSSCQLTHASKQCDGPGQSRTIIVQVALFGLALVVSEWDVRCTPARGNGRRRP